MKKFILSLAVLVAFATTSCKKAYECTCTETSTGTYEAVMDYYTADAEYYNENYINNNLEESNKTVTTLDKTSKAAANVNCASSENTWVETYDEDYDDADSDNDFDEPGVKYTSTSKTECSLEKK